MSALCSSPVSSSLLKPSLLLNADPFLTNDYKLKTKIVHDSNKHISDHLHRLPSALLTHDSALESSLTSSYPFDIISSSDASVLQDAVLNPLTLTTDPRSSLQPRRPLHRVPRFHNATEMEAQARQIRAERYAFDTAIVASTDEDADIFFSDDFLGDEGCESGMNDIAMHAGYDTFGFESNDGILVVEDDDLFFEESSFAHYFNGVEDIEQETSSVGHSAKKVEDDHFTGLCLLWFAM